MGTFSRALTGSAKVGYLLVASLAAWLASDMIQNNKLEHASGLPYAYFRYPLDIDINGVVDRTLKRRAQSSMIEPINKPSSAFLINPKAKCEPRQFKDGRIFMLLLIKSKMDNFENRRVIRETWGQEESSGDTAIRRVFLLGNDPHNVTLRDLVRQESQLHSDIVLQDFQESYFNNTVKLRMGFQWALQHCHNAEFLAFFDDDYYVDQRKVVERLQAVPDSQLSDTIIGYVLMEALAIRVPSSKWYISVDEYPFRFYPPYVIAGSFFVHRAAAERIFVATWYTKLLMFDDVYLGIVAKKLGLHLEHWHAIFPFQMPCEPALFTHVAAMHNFRDMELMKSCWLEQRRIHTG